MRIYQGLGDLCGLIHLLVYRKFTTQPSLLTLSIILAQIQRMQALNIKPNLESQTRNRLILLTGEDESNYDKTCEIEVLQIAVCSSFQKEECRICLEGNQQQLLIQCCSCKGSVRLMHRKCLALWIQKKLENVCTKISCEICHTLFNYHLQVSEYLEWEQFLRQWSRKKISIVLNFMFSIMLLLSFLWFNAAVFGTQNQIKRKIMSTEKLQLVTIFFMIIWGSLTILSLYSFIKTYFTKKIKKAIIEDQSLYKVVSVKKKFRDITKI